MLGTYQQETRICLIALLHTEGSPQRVLAKSHFRLIAHV
jgi:hypothetical protein